MSVSLSLAKVSFEITLRCEDCEGILVQFENEQYGVEHWDVNAEDSYYIEDYDWLDHDGVFMYGDNDEYLCRGCWGVRVEDNDEEEEDAPTFFWHIPEVSTSHIQSFSNCSGVFITPNLGIFCESKDTLLKIHQKTEVLKALLDEFSSHDKPTIEQRIASGMAPGLPDDVVQINYHPTLKVTGPNSAGVVG